MAKKNIATFLGPKKGLHITGKQAYAYSGDVAVNQTPSDGVTLLLFQSPKEIIKGWVTVTKNTTDGDDFIYRLYYNNVIIQGWINDYSAGGRNDDTSIPVIIPPLTEVKLTAYNDTGTTERNINGSITGKVYS